VVEKQDVRRANMVIGAAAFLVCAGSSGDGGGDEGMVDEIVAVPFPTTVELSRADLAALSPDAGDPASAPAVSSCSIRSPSCPRHASRGRGPRLRHDLDGSPDHRRTDVDRRARRVEVDATAAELETSAQTAN
jgi:hypothetical protein